LTRRERIATLLEFFRDVEEGFADRAHSDDRVIGMCRAWNHSSYVQLRRLLPELASAEPVAYWNLAERYTRWAETRRVAWCRKCGPHPPEHVGSHHKHGRGRLVRLVAKTEYVTSKAVRPAEVGRAIDWLEARWAGDATLPSEVLANHTERWRHAQEPA